MKSAPKGEGVWMDPSDCTKYFTCRSVTTAWAEKKQEVCYTESYFEATSGSCKWVDIGNYDSAKILGTDEESDGDTGPKKKKKDNLDNHISTNGNGKKASIEFVH